MAPHWYLKNCVAKIDPYGFPLELYGPTGRYRDNYDLIFGESKKHRKKDGQVSLAGESPKKILEEKSEEVFIRT